MTENQKQEYQEKNQEKDTQPIEIGAYYLIHEDSIPQSGIELVILVDGNKRWHIITKKRNGVLYTYVFFNDNNYIKRYIKLWKDKANNLMYYIGEYHGNLLYNGYIPIIEYSGCTIELPDTLSCNGKVIHFRNMPFIELIRQFGRIAVDPVIWVICNLLY